MANPNTGDLQRWWRGVPMDPRPSNAATDTTAEEYWWRGVPMDPFPPGSTTYSRSMSETVSISDSLVAAGSSFGRSMSETVSISESIGSVSTQKAMSESLSVSDSISIDVPIANRGMSETVAISDSISTHKISFVSMTETLTISDSISIALGHRRSMIDSAYASGTSVAVTPEYKGERGSASLSGTMSTPLVITLTSDMVGNGLMLVLKAGLPGGSGDWGGVVTDIVDNYGNSYRTGSAQGVDENASNVLTYTYFSMILPPDGRRLVAGDTITITPSGTWSEVYGTLLDFNNVGTWIGAPTGTNAIRQFRFVGGSTSATTTGDFFGTGPVPAGQLVFGISSQRDGPLSNTPGSTPSWSAPWTQVGAGALHSDTQVDLSVAYMVTTTPVEPAPTVSWTGTGYINVQWRAYAASAPVDVGISDSIMVHPQLHRVNMVDNAFAGTATIPAGPIGQVGTVSASSLSNPYIDIPITTDMAGDSLMIAWTGGGQTFVVTMEDSRNGAYANPAFPGFNGTDTEHLGAFGVFVGLRVLQPTQRLRVGDYVRIRFYDAISGLPSSAGTNILAYAYDWQGLRPPMESRSTVGVTSFGSSMALNASDPTENDGDYIIAVAAEGIGSGGGLVGFDSGFTTLLTGQGSSFFAVAYKRASLAGDTSAPTVTFNANHWMTGGTVVYSAVDAPVGITDSIVAVVTTPPAPPPYVPPPVPIPGTKTRLPTARWRIILFDENGNTLGYVKNPVSPKLTFTLNGIDSCSFGVYLDDKVARALDPLVTYVKVWRSVLGEQVDPNLPIFAGKLAPMDEDGATNLVTCTAFSPFYDLQFRYRWRVQVPGKKAGQYVWKVVQYTDTAPNIIWDLIDYTNNRAAGDGDTHIRRAITPFQGTATMIANPYVKAYDNTQIWSAISELVTGITLADSTFGGIDLIPQYVHTEGDPTLMILDTGLARGVYQPQAGLHYRVGRKNLVNMGRSYAVDTDKAATLIRATGQGGSLVTEQWADIAHGFDHDYIGREGLYEQILDMGDAVTYNILKQEALDSLKRRKPPIITVKPELSPAEPPWYGLDFGLGDVLPVASKRGRMEFQSNLRVYGAELTLSNNGNESCSLTLAEDVEQVVAVPS